MAEGMDKQARIESVERNRYWTGIECRNQAIRLLLLNLGSDRIVEHAQKA